MKRLILATSWIVLAIITSAANYFVPGTVWEFQMPGDPGPQVIYSLAETDESESEDIYLVLLQFPQYDRYGNPYGVTEGSSIPVMLDGEKVYAYVTWGGNTGWQLIYDFSLQPGEGCWIKKLLIMPRQRVCTGTRIYISNISVTSATNSMTLM